MHNHGILLILIVNFIPVLPVRRDEGVHYLKDAYWTFSEHVKVLIFKVKGTTSLPCLYPSIDIIFVELFFKDCGNNLRKIAIFND